METVAAATSMLSQELLDRCAERAGGYDRENRFFSEDFEELKQAGYLKLPIPRELGGFGFNLAQVCREQRRLAYHAPATALATNMHLVMMGIAADLYRGGDPSLQWVLEEGARGAVFAQGHSESGNDLPGLYSTTRAERVEGGYRFYGRKIFGSLSPVWTHLNLHAMDDSNPDDPRIVHAILPRDAAGYRIVETWDVLGMRATRSEDTVLEGAFVPDRNVLRVMPLGWGGADQFTLTLFAWGMSTFGNVYLACAQRACDLAVASARRKVSIGLGGKTMAFNPMIQYIVAEMGIILEAVSAHVDRVADDWSNGVDHGERWGMKLLAAKYHAVEGARQVAKLALDVTGGAGVFKGNELERLLRDTTMGPLHPANNALTHEVVGKTMLGNFGLEPRWG